MPSSSVRRFPPTLFASLLFAACQSQVHSPPGLAAAQLNCEDWNTDEFFEDATRADVRRCLKAGADANAKDEYNGTPLHWARSAAVVRELVRAGGDPNASCKPHYAWSTPLHWADNAEVAVALLKAGADISVVSEYGWTPLHTVQDPGARDKYGRTPLHGKYRVEMIELLADAGASVNAAGDRGVTPLHFASASKSIQAARRLVELGADVNARDDRGNTPLHEACTPDRSIVDYWAGMEPDPEDLRREEAELVALLLAEGAELDVFNNRGETPLHKAVSSGNEHTLRT